MLIYQYYSVNDIQCQTMLNNVRRVSDKIQTVTELLIHQYYSVNDIQYVKQMQNTSSILLCFFKVNLF